MTGMTDISRHGGDKKHRFAGESAYRDGLGIQVKDDALIDPALLGEVVEYSMQAENLVDDSDDDGGYEIGDTGPGMATKVVQTGFKLLFFPLILVYRGITSLRYIPQLCGNILVGIKNGPATLKRFGIYLLSIFSLNGRLGKVLIVTGTITGVIWFSRKIYAVGGSISAKRKARRLAAEEAVLEKEIRAEEAAKTATTTVQIQPGGHRKATATVQFTQSQQQPQNQPQQQPNTVAINKPHNHPHHQPQTVTPEPEHEETKSRRRIGFGQLSKLANAFKRSEPVASPDAASPNNEDRYDSFETTSNRWGTRKSMLFVASCLVMLIGSVMVARQVMQKNNDVAQNAPGEEADLEVGDQATESLIPEFGGYPGNPGTTGYAPQNNNPQYIPPAPDTTGFGMSGYNPFNPSINNSADYQPEPLAPSVPYNDPENVAPPAFAVNPLFNGQGGGTQIQVYDPEESVIDNQQISVNDMQRPFGAGATEYDNDNGFDYNNATAMTGNGQPVDTPFGGMGLAVSVSPTQVYSGNPNDLPDSLDTMPVTRPQTTLIAATPAVPYASTGSNPSPVATLQPEQSLIALMPPPRVAPERNTETTRQDNSPSLAEISRTLPNNMPGNFVSNDTGLSSMAITSSVSNPESTDLTPPASLVAGSNLMALTPANSANTNLANMVNDSSEQVAWVPMQQELPTVQPIAQPMTQPILQPGIGFGIVQNESPAPYSTQNPAPIAASTASAFSSAAVPTVDLVAPEIRAASPSETLSARGVSAPQVQTQAKITPSPMTISTTTPSTTLSSAPMQNMEPSVQPVNMVLSPQATMARQTPAQPVNTQPANMQPTVAPATIINATQDDIDRIVSNGIVSPSQHIATMPMVSSDTQARLISYDIPPTVTNAAFAPAYSAQPQQFQNTPTAQPNVSQATAAQQFASNGQNNMPAALLPGVPVQPNNMPVLRPNNIYIVQPGDSIYKIAKQELGSVRRYREIYELNRDRLPIGQDTLTAGIELLLPVGQ